MTKTKYMTYSRASGFNIVWLTEEEELNHTEEEFIILDSLGEVDSKIVDRVEELIR